MFLSEKNCAKILHHLKDFAFISSYVQDEDIADVKWISSLNSRTANSNILLHE